MSEELVEVEELGPFRLSGIADRVLEAPLAAAEVVFREIEAHERMVFEAFAGKYVRTGALEASLTSGSASGAIRRLNPLGPEFGSSVWYATFQGTEGPGEHKPPSALLRATEAEAAVAAQTMLEYALHGHERPA